MILAIDPGVRYLGWALFSAETLVAAGTSFSPAGHYRTHVTAMRLAGVVPVDCVALESMTVRGDGNRNPTPPQDLINVQTVGCLVAGWFSDDVRLLTALDWKSTIPKSVHHPRILEALDQTERGLAGCACERAGAHAKEVMDAIGIGLFFLKRTDKGGGRRT